MYRVYEIVLRGKYPGTENDRRTVYQVAGSAATAAAGVTQDYWPAWEPASVAECEDLPASLDVQRACGAVRAGTYAPPRVQSCTPELERAIRLLMQTDDYQVTGRAAGWAELVYVHNSPPHPVTRIEITQHGNDQET